VAGGADPGVKLATDIYNYCKVMAGLWQHVPSSLLHFLMFLASEMYTSAM